MKIRISFILTISILLGSYLAQDYSSQLYEKHQNYAQEDLTRRRFVYDDIVPIIESLGKDTSFEVKKVGESLEGRDIYLIRIGEGPVNVLSWSQMHGDESTATMALFDIFNFLKADDEFNEFRKDLLKRVTLYFIPMLNPDGAEKFKRRNALGIDLNRDALRLQFPESRALKTVRDSIAPEFGFNLHDQNTRYTAGRSPRSATLSFLAPAFNYEKDINEVRSRTMKLIVAISKVLSDYIPGHLGRYSDDFEPRAFGDNFVKWGTGSVLIESGGWYSDYEKQFIRRLNFVALLAGYNSIAHRSYETESIEDYHSIPENDDYLFDLLLRNLKIKYDGNYYTVDIGIDRDGEGGKSDSPFLKGSIDDIGDLSIFYGYSEIDCDGMEVIEGKVYPEEFEDISELGDVNPAELLKEGYIAVRLRNYDAEAEFTEFPLNIIVGERKFNTGIGINRPANFLIYKNNKPYYAVVNGFLYDLKIDKSHILNGIIYK